MYYLVVPITFALCSALFLAFHHVMGAMAEASCSRVSLIHHLVAMFLGLWVHWRHWDRVGEDAMGGANDDFPGAVVLQHFNMGYFLYDTIHVAVWDQKWLVHHCVVLTGCTASEIAGVFALANAVNTWVTELGSLMYSTYLTLRVEWVYVVFVLLYTISRGYFAIWSCTVLHQVRQALSAADARSQAAAEHPRAAPYPSWLPYAAAILQIFLLAVNLLFLFTHWRKLYKKYVGFSRTATTKKED